MMVYYRLQTSGFDTTPFLGEPRNPAYYPLLFHAAGYSPGPGWRSYDLSPEQLQIIYQDLCQKISRVPSHVTARPVDPSNLAAELAEFYPVALQTYSNNYGFSAISEAELAYYFEPLAKLLPHGIMLKAYSEGLFGYAFGFWDLAPLFQKAHGDVGAMEHSGEFIPSRLLAHTIGILPEQQKTGAAYLLLEEFFKYAVASKRPAIGCLAKDGPSLYDKCAKPSRTYHMFLKQI
jgi:GNAT superfamily N-acetyltransferase